MVGFAGLCDCNDGRFLWGFFGYEFSKTVGFGGVVLVTSFQRWSVLLGYEISMMVGFRWLRDLIEGRIC